jgi:hypothetical protein
MKERKVEQGKTYVGVVEDNLDPNKEGRLKIRIVDVFDEAKTEDLPWASPWKDLAGGQIGIPETGKVVICVFEQGDPYKPEYISTEHWNINLENKLIAVPNVFISFGLINENDNPLFFVLDPTKDYSNYQLAQVAMIVINGNKLITIMYTTISKLTPYNSSEFDYIGDDINDIKRHYNI